MNRTAISYCLSMTNLVFLINGNCKIWTFDPCSSHLNDSSLNVPNISVGKLRTHKSLAFSYKLCDSEAWLTGLNHVIMQIIVEIPYVFIQTAYYSLIVYAMVSFEWTAAKFFWFFFISFFSFLYFTYYGMMTVSITPNHQVSAIFASAFYGLFNLFSGFFIPRPVSIYKSFLSASS